MSSRWWAALVPVAAGAVLGGLWWLADGRTIVTLTGSIAFVPVWAGAAASVVFGAMQSASRRERRRAAALTADAVAAETERHRRFVARLDHELKNPIQGIRSALADVPSHRQLDSIDRQTRRLAGVLSDLRRLSEAESVALDVAPVDLTALVTEAVEVAQELPAAAEREWRVSLPRAPRPLPQVQGDHDLLTIALSNLLVNAVKYSGAGAEIEVRGYEDVQGVAIEVADTGMGIPADELATVWEELGRGREARGIEGSGVGLPFVRLIVARHGGSVRLRSRHGEGTAVTIALPLGAGPLEPIRQGR
jgi:signal transduction histidine kinase